jgi:hypothetical protein
MLAAITSQSARAAIMGGEGNQPIADPGWPQGAAVIFNHPSRIAWWEGPPFGGGQWHAECRGDSQALSGVLADFARLDLKRKRVILHDGVGRSFWLNPNREPAKQSAAEIDWIFMVWQPANWEHLRKLPRDLNPTDPGDVDAGPPSQIDVYTGGKLRWSDVSIPGGLEVIDQRLEAHGFTTTDGVVLEGSVVDLANEQPIAARIQLQRVEPQATGGYHHTVVSQTTADAQGHWVLQKAPAGWHRVVVEADGYVPRVIGYAQFDDQPGWHRSEGRLSQAAVVSGHVTDDAGQPLAGVNVRLADVGCAGDGRYESTDEYLSQTGADGSFRLEQVPIGSATIRLHRKGYCRPGLGQEVTTPAENVLLQMTQSAQVRITVEFSGANRPDGYIVQMEPEGGSQVGKWSGSGNVDAQNQISFRDVPPGRYVVTGRPNPGSDDQHSQPMTIDLQGGSVIDVTLPAK